MDHMAYGYGCRWLQVRENGVWRVESNTCIDELAIQKFFCGRHNALIQMLDDDGNGGGLPGQALEVQYVVQGTQSGGWQFNRANPAKLVRLGGIDGGGNFFPFFSPLAPVLPSSLRRFFFFFFWL